MDQLVVDVGSGAVQPGDRVTLFGPGDRGEPTVDEWAGWAETLPHEIVTGIGSRVTRTFRPATLRSV
jgi:alanine racemase